ncbi:hypothetical protein QFC21_000618 [Naganishia friedmannii]|uniref:Uncharacterized protein n=1 Tax=Naganishia friedmannii TaxID=89922 RepID=A0ACC2WDL4_9TREE|nr:hypothetical protein QFC21_000618 [Naganishia friedmannii]
MDPYAGIPPILQLETTDVRPLSRLLRGVGFNSKATVVVSDAGLSVQVDEGRSTSAIAYISSKLMDKYTYTRKSDIERHIRRAQKEERFRRCQARQRAKSKGKATLDDDVFGQNANSVKNRQGGHQNPSQHAIGGAENGSDQSSDDDENENDDDDLEPPGSDDEEYTYEVAEFEVNLKHWIECLNIHGNAAVAPSSSHHQSGFAADRDGGANTSGGGGGGGRSKKRWIMDDDEPSGGRGFGTTSGAREKDVRNTSLIMTWQGEGEPLTLLFFIWVVKSTVYILHHRKDDDAKSPTTRCMLNLLDPEEVLDEVFEQERIPLIRPEFIRKGFTRYHEGMSLFTHPMCIAQVDIYLVPSCMTQSTWLQEALADLDPSCSKITITIAPPNDLPDGDPLNNDANDAYRVQRRKKLSAREKAGIFRLEAVGNFGQTELDYPNDKDVMDVFLCSQHQRFSYAYSTFILCQKALLASIKVSLRIDDDGFLSLQLMMPKPAFRELEGKDFGIIEFKMKPLQEDDE